MRYTIEELEWLRNERLKGFDIKESLDDVDTNKYYSFKKVTDTFIEWLTKMEESGKIQFLLTECKKNIYEQL